ncbi:MAG TPA: uroporphyrinogen-III synthase [Gaiellaceae bacterium]|nr:uroporphyrinogen-III synthase [Gaiellaceae bacterium]
MTRSEEQAGALAERIEGLGAEVVLCPLIRTEPLGDATVDVVAYDWVVVTSPNGAAELARRLEGSPRRLAAIGPGTAAALRERGLEPDLVPATSTQEGLLAELPDPPGRVLLAAAEGARRLLADELGADFLALYRTIELVPEEPPDGDLVVLSSPSAARAFARTGARIAAVAIGPQTAGEARALGLDVVAEAETHDLDGLAAAVERALATR